MTRVTTELTDDRWYRSRFILIVIQEAVSGHG